MVLYWCKTQDFFKLIRVQLEDASPSPPHPPLIFKGISGFKVFIYKSTLCLKQIDASLIQINEVIYVQKQDHNPSVNFNL